MIKILPSESKIQNQELNISKSQIINLLDESHTNNLSLDNVQLLKNQLLWKYQASTIFKKINQEVLKFVIRYSQGNPLRALSFFQCFLVTGFFEKDHDRIEFTKKLKEIISYDLMDHDLKLPFDQFSILSTEISLKNAKILANTSENLLMFVACEFTL